MRRLAPTIAALTILVAPAAAHAARVPDLAVKDAGVLQPVLVAGAKTKISVVVQNKGRAVARKGVIRFFLIPEKGRRKPLAGKAVVRKLKPKKTRTVSARVKVPGSLKPGSFTVLACVDPAAADARAANDCPRPKKAEPIGVLAKPGPRKSVSPQLDSTAHVADGVISRDGGTLSAYTSDFKRLYTLVVPPGALANDQHIEIKPLTGVQGMDIAGSMIAGVQLEPAGLEFSRPAALVVREEGLKPAPGQTPFAYNGNGSDLRLSAWFLRVPDFVQGHYDPENGLVLPIEHFSGVVIAPATDLETARQLSYDAMDARDRLSQDLAKEINAERDRQLKGEEDGATDLSELTDKAIGAFLEQVILPQAAAASFSDAMYERAVRDLIGWERQRQLLGQSEELPAKYRALMNRINQLLEIAWEKVIERAEKRCYAGDFSLIARIIPLERQRQLLDGIEGGRNEFSEAFVRCFKFELRLKSRVLHKGKGDLGFVSAESDETYEVAATVPLAIEGQNLEVLYADLKGSAPLTYTVVQNTGSGTTNFGGFGSGSCTFRSTGNTREGLVDVTQGWLGLGIDGNTVKRIAQPFLTLDLGDPQEEINSQCQGEAFGQPYNTNENKWERNFMRYWSNAHSDEKVNPDSGDGGDPVAGPFPGPWLMNFEHGRWPISGTYNRDYANETAGSRVVDTWELVHTPPARR